LLPLQCPGKRRPAFRECLLDDFRMCDISPKPKRAPTPNKATTEFSVTSAWLKDSAYALGDVLGELGF